MTPLETGIFLSLGTNLGNRPENLRRARKEIEDRDIDIIADSPVYSTAAWGKSDQDAFLNQVLKIQTPLEPDALLHALMEIEYQMGRLRLEKWGPRIIDIDIIFYDQTIISKEFLTIPHPRMTERLFVLVPLNDIAPQMIHPVYRKTIHQLLQECTDTLEVIKFEI